MKKIACLLVAYLLLVLNASAQYVTIPDANFRSFLKTQYPSCFNGSDQMNTSCGQITSATSLFLGGKNIADLDGVQYFTGLTSLNCLANQLTSLPTLPPNLQTLICDGNQLTSLPALPASLTGLSVAHNNITSLPALPTGLGSLICDVNPLTTLPTLPANLSILSFGATSLSSFPALPANLTSLACTNFNLTSLPTLPATLINLDCSLNQLTALPAIPSTLLKLNCASNQITTLPTLPSGLTDLYCNNNQLTSLPALPNSLKYLYCYSNQLTSLPTLSSSLLNLNCGTNQLTSLPTLNAGLQVIACTGNQLTSLPALPVSLLELECYFNRITVLPTLPAGLVYLTAYSNCFGSIPTNPNPTTLTTFTVSPNRGDCSNAISSVTGPTTVCKNQTSIQYSVVNTPGATYYWTVPTGMSITNGNGTNVITVSTDNSGLTGLISVYSDQYNTPSGLNVVFDFFPAIFVSGPNPVCTGTTNTYSTSNVRTGSTYNWTVPNGSTIVGGQGMQAVQVLAGTLSGTITMIETSASGCKGPTYTIPVNISGSAPAPITITSSAASCTGSNVVFSVANTPGSLYAWHVPSGSTLVSGNGTNSIIVAIGSGAGNIQAAERNAAGCFGSIVNYAITPGPSPVTSSITGNTSVCVNSSQNYSVVNTTGSSYTWSTPSGTIINSGQGSSVISTTIGTTSGSMMVTETATNGCSGTPVNISLNPIASPATSAISGAASVCSNAGNKTYSVVNTSGSTYSWSLAPGTGATITSGQGSNSIVVNYSNYLTSGTISVTETSSGGCIGAPVTFNVAALAIPVTSSITGASFVCGNAFPANYRYSVTNTTGSTYSWTAPVGASIIVPPSQPPGFPPLPTNIVIVNYASFTGSGNITVKETAANGCLGLPVNFSIATSPAAPIVSGPVSVCRGTTQTYNITNGNPSSNYNWTLTPSNALTLVSQGATSAQINFASYTTTGMIAIQEVSAEGCTGTATYVNITATAVPTTTFITGPDFVCSSATAVTYSVSNTSGSTYNWTLPTGMTINSGQGSNQIAINASSYAVVGSLKVVETSAQGCAGAASTKNIGIVNSSPYNIIGSNEVCASAIGVQYSVPSNPIGYTSTYNWTLPLGATIATPPFPYGAPNGQGQKTIFVNYSGFSSGAISVTETTSFGCSFTTNLNVVTTTSNYQIPAINVSCNHGVVDVSLNTINTISPNVVGLTFVLNFDPTVMTPVTTGTQYTLGEVVNAGGAATVNMHSYSNQLVGIISYTGTSGSTGPFAGQGNVITLKFKLASSVAPGTNSSISTGSLIESYSTGGGSANCLAASTPVNIITTETLLTGKILLSTGTALGYDAANPSRYLITNIYGSSNNFCNDKINTQQPNVSGSFVYNTVNGNYFNIKRDIPDNINQDTLLKYLNASDVQALYNMIIGTTSVPTIYDVLAADVDMDGKILAGDKMDLINRILSTTSSFPQPSIAPDNRDWLFIDQTTLNTPAYSPGQYFLHPSSYYFNSATTLPVTPQCLSVVSNTSSNGCSTIPNETYRGILLGDIASARFYNAPGTGLRTSGQSTGELIFDLTKTSHYEDGTFSFPVFFSGFDTSVTAIDFRLDYDEEQLELVSVSKPNSSQTDELEFWYNNYQKEKLFLTSFSNQALTEYSTLFNIRMKSLNSTLSSDQFAVEASLLNGEKVGATVIDATGTTTNSNLQDIVVYPVPTTDLLNISGVYGDFDIDIINTLGKLVYKNKSINSIDLNELPSGVYYMTISTNGNKKIIKFNKL